MRGKLMKAAQISEYGDVSVVKISDIDQPTAGEGQVLVEVHASSINPIDIAIRTGAVKQMMPLTLPATLGGDFAGIIAEIGSGVTNVAVGDRVYGQANAAFGNSGAFAEYAVTVAGQVAKAPANIDFKLAASLPLVGASAVQALVQHIKLAADQKILITGGTGGIGSIAIQIAKHLGAHVTATATGEGLELAQQLGADEVIDYQSQDISALKDFDAVFDTVGGETTNKALHALKPGGIAVSMSGHPDEELAKELNITAIRQFTQVTTETLDTLRELVEQQVIVPQVEQIFALDDIAAAFGAKENGDVKGKVVIAIKD
jgi:NADPH:quinone reductase-like Zn-dependent oxidoreductase